MAENKKKAGDSSLLPCLTSTSTPPLSPTSTTTSCLPSPTTPVKTTVKWAEKRTNGKGVVMVADLENQKKPLIKTSVEMKEKQTTTLDDVLGRNADEELRKLVGSKGQEAVLRLPARHDNALHKAVSKDAGRCLTVLLNPKPVQNFLEAPNDDGQTPLMLAVALAKPPLVQQLLDAGADPNTRNEHGYTPLHVLANALDKGRLPEVDLLKLTDILLARGDVDLEPHADLTPLATAAITLPQNDGVPRRGSLLSFCKKLVDHGASLNEATGEGTVEEVLRRKQALTSVLMGERCQAPARPAHSQFLDLIYANKSGSELENFLRSKSPNEAKIAASSRLGKYTLLFKAVDNKNESLVKILLKYKADPWVEEITNELPLYRAASRGHLAIFDQLITSMKGNDGTDLSKHTVQIMLKLMENWKRDEKQPKDIDHAACFSRLLEPDVKLNVNQEWNGKTALHVAASFNKQEAVTELLKHGAYLGARPIVIGDMKAPSVLTTLRQVTLKKAMDGCIKHLPQHKGQAEDEALTNPDYSLLLDFRFLIPPDIQQSQQSNQSPSKSISEVEMLMEINRSRHHRHVITHPLVQTLLYGKWRKALPFYTLNLALYFFFVVILTFFVYNLKDLRIRQFLVDNPNKTNSSIIDLEKRVDEKWTTVIILMAILLLVTGYMLVREIVQIKFTRLQYLKNIENYLECFLIIAVLILCIFNLSVDETTHLSAWAMIVAWYEFVLIFGRVPSLALYITMLRHVSLNFFKFIFLFGSLIVAFTISFNILLQQSGEEFHDFGSTLPKAIVMSTGEFEYSSLSKQFVGNSMWCTASAVSIFLVFLFLIFLVLMNVMNGLAITDTKDVLDDAILYSLTSRLELIYLIESLYLHCPSFLKKYLGGIQLLTGENNSPRLLAKINRTKKTERLWSGKIMDDPNRNNEEYLSSTKLNGKTVECLRAHRLNHLADLEEKERERRSNSMVQLEAMLRQVVENNSTILQRTPAAGQ